MSEPNNYFNSIVRCTHLAIKTLILASPEDCLNANKIIKNLKNNGCQILPICQYQNEIHISYIEKECECLKKNDIIDGDNIMEIKNGFAGTVFIY